MRKITFWLLVAFVFSLPWEEVLVLGPLGTVSRAVGALAVVAGLLTAAAQGRLRMAGSVLFLGVAFVMSNVLTVFWTINVDATIETVLSYAQLLAIAWVVCEFARGRAEQDVLLVAFCAGTIIALASQFDNYFQGIVFSGSATGDVARYAPSNANPNDFGFSLALTIPVAWYFFITRRFLARAMVLVFLPVVLVGILLTGSSGAMVCAVAALCVIVFSRPARAPGAVALLAGLLLSVVIVASTVVPTGTWTRMLTTATELQSGTLSGRTLIWDAGMDVFYEHPLLGIGSGAFGTAVEFVVGNRASHNTPLAILVEQGIVGFSIFAMLVGACLLQALRLSLPNRVIWMSIWLTWLLGSMSMSWQSTKVTWLLFGMMAALATGEDAVPADARAARRGAPRSTGHAYTPLATAMSSPER